MRIILYFSFLLLGCDAFTQSLTLPPYYGVQNKPDFICGESTVTDYQGNVYNTVKIGSQCWLKQNLRATKYNDGTNIPNVTNDGAWYDLTTPAYCWYENNYSTYGSVYGALYNWYAVNTGKLCPVGWHVPSDVEWTQLSDFLGGEGVAGGKLKETGTTYWNSPNTGATNVSGFTALPGGCRSYLEGFYSLKISGNWWSSSEEDANYALDRNLNYNLSQLSTMIDNKWWGLSVRCVKD
jgi:uncharacterized protein (TIGR02145 family)